MVPHPRRLPHSIYAGISSDRLERQCKAASPIPRAAIALLFAAPAAVAGYHATLGLAHIGVPSMAWRQVFAVIGAIAVGGTAFVRMSAMASPPFRTLAS